MKSLLFFAAIGLLLLTGCSTCHCGCPYCCDGKSTDYSNPTGKPASDIPIWWETENNK